MKQRTQTLENCVIQGHIDITVVIIINTTNAQRLTEFCDEMKKKKKKRDTTMQNYHSSSFVITLFYAHIFALLIFIHV